jgi:hypothetical protein
VSQSKTRRSARPPEAPRDQDESGFTPILRSLWADHPGVLAVAFVDQMGECVDYCSSLSPFDAKVAGATLLIVLEEIAPRCHQAGAGIPKLLHLVTERTEFVARRVTDEYLLVVLVRPARVVRKLVDAIEAAVVRLRQEAGAPVPSWDVVEVGLRVEVRVARGWPYAPSAFVEAGARVEVQAVLGRWVEGAEATGGELVCFRIQTAAGEELTLAHDLVSDRWLRR